jgi:serine phosphatase RsbU (regulator of sigma subunit)
MMLSGGVIAPARISRRLPNGIFDDAEGADGQYYDQRRLLKSVSRRVDLRAEELCKQLVAEVREFAVSKDFSDDVCLIAIEVDHLMKA